MYNNLIESFNTYLGLLELNTLHTLEGVEQGKGTLVQTLRDTGVLLVVELEARITLEGRVDHALEQTLCDDRRAQANADELVDLLLD